MTMGPVVAPVIGGAPDWSSSCSALPGTPGQTRPAPTVTKEHECGNRSAGAQGAEFTPYNFLSGGAPMP